MFDFLSSALPAAMSWFGGEQANRRNEDASQRTMDFQENMSNSAHQREVNDLKAAGLNPMLSLKNGGASAPAGSTPQMNDTVSPAVNTAMNARMQLAQMENIKAQTAASEATARKTNAEASMVPLMEHVYTGQARSYNSAADAAQAGIPLKGQEYHNARAQFDVILQQAKKLGYDIENVDADTLFKKMQTLLSSANVDNTNADTILKGTTNKLRELDLNEAKVNSQFYGSTVGETSGLLRFLLPFLKAAKGN